MAALPHAGSPPDMRPDLSIIDFARAAPAAISGLETALWDILGQSLGAPIYQLLGGRCRDRVRSYTYLYPAEGDTYPPPGAPSVYDDPDLAAERAAEARRRTGICPTPTSRRPHPACCAPTCRANACRAKLVLPR